MAKTYDPTTITPEQFIAWLDSQDVVIRAMWHQLYSLLAERMSAKSAALLARDMVEEIDQPCDDPLCETCHPETANAFAKTDGKVH